MNEKPNKFTTQLESEIKTLKGLNQMLCDGQGELELKHKSEIKQLKEELKHYKEPFESRPTYQIIERQLEQYKSVIDEIKNRIEFFEEHKSDTINSWMKYPLNELTEILSKLGDKK